MRNRLILDTDGGVDDAQALILLAGNGVVPHAITTVFGNVGLDAATRNILDILATLGLEVPVYKGTGLPLIQPIIDATYVHGEDGLGGAPRPVSAGLPENLHAVDFLRSAFRQAAADGEKIDLLMIGPLTNLALALRLDPDIVAGIGRLVIMGGTLHGRGNVTPAAEFNVFADPEAAAIVFGTKLDTVLVPWETCLAHAISGAEIDACASASSGPAAAFSLALARHLRDNAQARGRGDQLLFIDPLAAAVVVAPDIVTGQLRASVATVLDYGIARGMTLIDPAGRVGTPVASVVESVDIARLKTFYLSSLGGYRP